MADSAEIRTWTVAWEHARAQFPDVEVVQADFQVVFLRYSTRAGVDQPSTRAGDPRVVEEDLYLACACARGDSRAIEAFRQRYASVFEKVRARFGPRAPSRDELWSDVARRLFVSDGTKPPRIADYAGDSELGAWVRVVALRVILNRLDAAAGPTASEDRIFEGLLVTYATPELEFGRAEHRAVMLRAFAQALAGLPPRERRLLRLAFVEGFTIDDLARFYSVHRSTAARWTKDAVVVLRARVVERMRAELNLSREAYEVWLRELSSSLDLSVTRYLAAAPDD
jgi:RNA polymerase sigma-70 factor (ECF subfamily)